MGELSKELTHHMNRFEMFSIPLPFKIPYLGDHIQITNTVVMSWFIMLIVILLAVWLSRGLSPVPGKKQTAAELLVGFVNGIAKDTIGHHWRDFAPYLGSTLMFLLISNTVSVFNIIPNFNFLKFTNVDATGETVTSFFTFIPPTKDINVTASMAIMTITIVIFSGIRYKGIKKFLLGFLKPLPFMLPFNILDYIIKPLSLCLRLFGNILAAFAIMEVVYKFVPLAVPAALSLYFDLFDGLLQAYIFVFLTSLYVGEVIEEH